MNKVWQLRDYRSVDFSKAPLIMGILNCTPDSFFNESRLSSTEQAVKTALEMEKNGAAILDIGGESSRPGSDYVSAEEEIKRVIPVIKAIRAQSSIPLSVDTRKMRVAREAWMAGADIINDISGLTDDKEMIPFAASENIPVIIMHMKGRPDNMQKNPEYKDAVEEIALWLEQQACRAAGMGISRIALDPGIGFGKRLQDNLSIIKHIKRFQNKGYPILIGASRKSFIGTILDKEVSGRLAGSLGAHALAALNGAAILRVHDVEETFDMIQIISAVNNSL